MLRKFLKILLILFSLTALSYSQWVQQSSGTTNLLLNIFFADQNTGFAVGITGTVLKTTNGGTNWILQSVTGQNLFGVFFLNPMTGYICGGGGLISKTTDGGASWVTQAPPVELYINIFFLDQNTGFACGTSGIIIKTTNGGTNWVQQNSGVSLFLQSIKFTNTSTGYSAGYNGTVVKTTDGGANWSTLTTGVTDHLFGMALISASTVYVSGEAGRILKTTNGGASWVNQVSNAGNRIVNLFFVNANTGTGAGHGNIIIRTTNGGAAWIPQSSGLSGIDFYGVHFTSQQTGYIAGDNGKILYTNTGGFPIPPAPNLLVPSNGAINVSLTPLLAWDSAASAKTYQLQLATDSNFTSPILDTSLLVTTQFTIPSGILNNNVLYYWRVRSQNAAGNGPWSSIFRFRTIVALPNAPGLLLPLNGAINVSLTPFFDWDSTSPADSYTLQASLDTSFTNLQVFIVGITQSFLNLTNPPLQHNFRYYWRVNAVNFAGTSPWSAVFNFTTVFGIPAAPVLLYPPNNAIGINLTPTLDWIDDISAISYQLQLSQDSTFGTTIIDSTGFSVSQLTVRSGLLVNVQSYYWRVRTTNSIGTGPYSQRWKFTTLLSPPGIPVLIDPPNGAINISTTPTLDWNDVPFTETYRVQVSGDSTFASTLINAGGLTFSQYPVPGGILQNNTTYFWRVNASNSAGSGPFSAVWRFRTVVTPPVAAPVLLSPPNGAVNQGITPTLDWSDVFGADGYKVLVSADSLFNTWLIDTTIGATSQFTVPPGILSGSTTYYWRVRAFNIGGFGPWSVTWRFSTAPIGINIIGTEIPTEFKLYNNYPNPFNPVTRIKFDIPVISGNRAADVKVIIFDITGKEVTILVNRQLSPGRYEAEWNASKYSTGVYFFRIIAEDFTDIKKMVLVK